ncbi:transcription initiation factor IIF, partial [Gardnerella vaginalis]
GNVPSDSVVWYKGDENRAAAQDIAKTLGISNVEATSEITTTIVVVLCK